jgi:hypothetical protein
MADEKAQLIRDYEQQLAEQAQRMAGLTSDQMQWVNQGIAPGSDEERIEREWQVSSLGGPFGDSAACPWSLPVTDHAWRQVHLEMQKQEYEQRIATKEQEMQRQQEAGLSLDAQKAMAERLQKAEAALATAKELEKSWVANHLKASKALNEASRKNEFVRWTHLSVPSTGRKRKSEPRWSMIYRRRSVSPCLRSKSSKSPLILTGFLGCPNHCFARSSQSSERPARPAGAERGEEEWGQRRLCIETKKCFENPKLGCLQSPKHGFL